jgi:prepilin-type N-terminal cleavage/methylation domain-containing protein
MPGKSNQLGFSLLELLVVMMLLGIMATVSVRVFQSVRPGYARRAFVAKVNSLLITAVRSALMTQRVQRLLFDLEHNTLYVQESSAKDDQKENFQDIAVEYVDTRYTWPETITLQQFFIGKKDEMAGKKTTKVWLYIMPDGTAQDVTINAVDTADKQKQIGLVINPFTAQLSMYDTFQKP